jgi:DNA (cytosine-5)-methyltransferase 1
MPRFCVFENVPGILSIAADEICQELERIGYSVGICCFEAAAVGAPHRRARVFFVAHSRRRMREGGSVAGEIRGEPETRPSPDIERSGGAPLADAKSERRRLRDYCQDIGTANREIDSVGDPSVLRGDVSYADGNGCSALEESYRFSRTNGPIGDSGAIPDADCKWKLQQSRGIAKVGERFGDVCETPANPDSERREEQRRTITEDGERAAFKRSERCCRWESESGLGRNIDGLSPWLHGDWERGILRVAKGAKNRVARLRALGNAVVPAQIYPIFRAIAEIEGRDE